ncbi:hypothetical protein [Massilia sp. MS-15]|uniref:hypothetical protein n=1 Tax=Massilia sp. MS-15 TaxID=2878200 RepID=UPI001CD26034|nr:hypothetical protein [Massilia sp. MS-15]MCA1248676.1 hypothetical protein [Massilia sp. MS-15]
MRIFSVLTLAACLFASAAAWADPVPADKLAYVGSWHGKDMQLSLSKEGKVKYKRNQPGKQLDLSLDLLGFNGNNFDIGVEILGSASMRSTFVVSKPPQREGGKWKMTVDGIELTRDE